MTRILDDLVQFLGVENLQIPLVYPYQPGFVEPGQCPANGFQRQAEETSQVEPRYSQVKASVGVTEARVALAQNQQKRCDPRFA